MDSNVGNFSEHQRNWWDGKGREIFDLPSTHSRSYGQWARYKIVANSDVTGLGVFCCQYRNYSQLLFLCEWWLVGWNYAAGNQRLIEYEGNIALSVVLKAHGRHCKINLNSHKKSNVGWVITEYHIFCRKRALLG